MVQTVQNGTSPKGPAARTAYAVSTAAICSQIVSPTGRSHLPPPLGAITVWAFLRTRYGSAYLLLRLSALECLNSFACL